MDGRGGAPGNIGGREASRGFVARKRSRAAAWAYRICLLALLCAAASGGGAVSAEPPALRGPAGVHAIPVSEATPSRTLGIAAQDSWLGD